MVGNIYTDFQSVLEFWGKKLEEVVFFESFDAIKILSIYFVFNLFI